MKQFFLVVVITAVPVHFVDSSVRPSPGACPCMTNRNGESPVSKTLHLNGERDAENIIIDAC
jgi:hypothetical protein